MLMAEIQSLRIFIRKHDWRNSRINVRILNYNEVNNIPKMEIAYPGLRYQVKISSSLPYNIFCLDVMICGQSYNASTIINYDSRVVISDIFKSDTTLES